MTRDHCGVELTEQESNFLRDQSGMKRQLSTLQKLIGVMDPELYAHLGESWPHSAFIPSAFARHCPAIVAPARKP
jgi:hypothetical protein